MKICIVGDQHFRLEQPYSSAVSDGRKGEWEAVKKTIHDTAKGCDVIVLLGDGLNARHNNSSVIREFVEFLNGFGDKPIHILIGNHERYGTSTALDFLDKVNHPNWTIYSSVTEDVQLFLNVSATFVPYMTPALMGVETKEDAENILNDLKKADIAFFHHAITGTKNTEFFDEIMIDQSKLKSGFTFGGHVHKPERLSNTVIVTGNLMTHEIGEHRKMIWVWDSVTNTALDIPLPVREIHKVDWNNDPDKIFGGIPDNSIVKCIVTIRGTDIDLVHETLKRFDAHLVVEQYQSEREKTHFEGGALDLGIENLLKLYAEAKGVVYEDLKSGFEMIKN